jgi:hypothetical protein
LRRDAIVTGRIAVRVQASLSGFVVMVAAYPTGLVLVDSSIAVPANDSTSDGAVYGSSY